MAGDCSARRPWPACEEPWWCEQSLGWPCPRALVEPGKLSPGRDILSLYALPDFVPGLYHQRCPVPSEMDKDGVSAPDGAQEEHEVPLAWSMGHRVPVPLL